MRLSEFILAVAAAVLSVVLSATGAMALTAVAKSGVNVRSGPGTGFGVVDTLHTGEAVTVGECRASGWCYVNHSGPDGWVYSTYLKKSPGSGGGSNPDCGLSLTLNSGTPSLTINCGNNPPPPAPAPAPAPEPTQACFYTNQNFGGARFCQGPGTRNWLNGTFNNQISSISIQGGAKVRLCSNGNQTGFCRVIQTNRSILGSSLNNRVSSFVVFTGPSPVPVAPPAPVTYSTGGIALQQTFSANLDNGTVTSGGGADIFYEAVTSVNKFLTPVNGAQLALGDGSSRGFAGCSTASFSTARVSVWAMPPGTYVCARTNHGRISQFRVNSAFGGTVNLGYTTWQ